MKVSIIAVVSWPKERTIRNYSIVGNFGKVELIFGDLANLVNKD